MSFSTPAEIVAQAERAALNKISLSFPRTLVAAMLAAIATIAIAQIALGLVKSDLARAAIGLVFALPAALAGYHAVHGIAAATMPASSWQVAVSLIGATVVATASWTQWAAARQ